MSKADFGSKSGRNASPLEDVDLMVNHEVVGVHGDEELAMLL